LEFFQAVTDDDLTEDENKNKRPTRPQLAERLLPKEKSGVERALGNVVTESFDFVTRIQKSWTPQKAPMIRPSDHLLFERRF